MYNIQKKFSMAICLFQPKLKIFSVYTNEEKQRNKVDLFVVSCVPSYNDLFSLFFNLTLL